eukprot:CAMPEP_0113466016 /NCGR_PEP_ID=MMETSP0014_2-20120614/14046_1 /TAXON_ID=2857 /ORGANISM="Nitzschia sp." /LENGTH=562 /DNA_ID=CAMNT_0000358209 /DNA_START=74 /DNA_END=1762 /DNA_ORIENTATION=- /assembly_acc=CAM_ASM_000159
MVVEVTFDPDLYDEARALDQSSWNRSNIQFSCLSIKIAKSLLSSTHDDGSVPTIHDLTVASTELSRAWNDVAGAGSTRAAAQPTPPPPPPPFCCVEGVAYAVNALKVKSVQGGPCHVRIVVPFYCEHERGRKATADENPNGEESAVQKVQECLFLLDMNPQMSMDLVFVNDSIAEKKDEQDGGSARLFLQSILEYVKENCLVIHKGDADADTDTDTDTDASIMGGGTISLDLGQLSIRFTSCEVEASKGTPYESAKDRRARFENRDAQTGKLQERKGGAVLAGMELPLPDEWTTKGSGQQSNLRRTIRCLVDGDSAHPVASFVGDAVYSILELGHVAYLGNMKHPCTCISIAPEVGSGGGGGGGGGESAGTRAKVKNRKLFFSGFIVPFLFPELSLKYNYTGTTQLPVKAFRGDIDFCKATLSTVQPNVDLGMLALLCTTLNEHGGTIDSGPVTIRDNVASSTMTTTDLGAEWNKTYGPIFTSAVSLCRTLKPDEFEKLDPWVTAFIENMQLKHYETLFGEDTMKNSHAQELFATMEQFKGANDRVPILARIKSNLKTLFPE